MVFLDIPENNQDGASFSPNGNWIAYSSFEGGGSGIYVEPFPRVPGVQYEIINGGEIFPTWSRDGRELFFSVTQVSGRPPGIYRVDIRTDPSPAVTSEEAVVDNYLFLPRNPNYDVMPDGERVLVVLPEQQDSAAPARPQINVVLNWFEELKERVPVP